MVPLQAQGEGRDRALQRWSVAHDVEEAKLKRYKFANQYGEEDKLTVYEREIKIDQLRDLKWRESIHDYCKRDAEQAFRDNFKQGYEIAQRLMDTRPTPTGLTRRQKLLLS
jgi:hypothetical protein